MTLYAKSDGETLYNHSILVYEYGMKIIEMMPVDKEEREKYKLLASLPLLFHDIGKAASGFQNALIRRANWKGLRHEILSSCFLSQFKLSDEQLLAVITHHKDIPGSDSKSILPKEQIDQSEGDTDILKSMKKEFENNGEEINRLCCELFCFIKAGMDFNINMSMGVGISDIWLEGSHGSRYGQMRKVEAHRRVTASIIRGIIKTADHMASSHIPLIPQVKLSEFKVIKYYPRGFQNKCSMCNGSLLLTAPTGSGKTEAVLLWAQNNQKENGRMFYVLPYQASINAMHKRLSDIFGNDRIGVLHANAISYLYNIQDGEDEFKLDNQKKAMELSNLAHEIYYPIRVCTPHQLLRFGLKGKGWETLFIEFKNSIIIYDEIHAYQPRITGLTLSTAKLLKNIGARMAFVSATFPDFLKRLLKERLGDIEEISPDIKTDSDVINKKRHIIKTINGTLIENIDLIKETIDLGKSILIIANHVKTAQIIYDILNDYKPLLIHSRFNKRDRREKENRLMSENKPQIVIATQVIEVSLDIDYEAMFTEPAPIDALSQRFGRVNRRGNREPEYIFVSEQQISKHSIYDSNRTKKTVELLKNISNPIGEADLVSITNDVYNDGYTIEEMEEFELGYNNEEILDFEKNLIAGVSRDWVSDIIDKIGGVCEVLPVQYVNEYDRLMEQGLWIDAKDLMVNVSYNMVRENISKMKDIYIVNCIYNSEKGLLTNEKPSNFDID